MNRLIPVLAVLIALGAPAVHAHSAYRRTYHGLADHLKDLTSDCNTKVCRIWIDSSLADFAKAGAKSKPYLSAILESVPKHPSFAGSFLQTAEAIDPGNPAIPQAIQALMPQLSCSDLAGLVQALPRAAAERRPYDPLLREVAVELRKVVQARAENKAPPEGFHCV